MSHKRSQDHKGHLGIWTKPEKPKKKGETQIAQIAQMTEVQGDFAATAGIRPKQKRKSAIQRENSL
jgi:hypothetical protein